MVLVDIILPMYKADDVIYQSINSVISQTYRNWHLYIIDDASGDNRLDEIKTRYKDHKDKISYYQFRKNRRAAACRNYAIHHGHGDYLAFIDQDDVWLSHKLKTQVDYLEKTKFDVVHGDFLFIDYNGKFILEALSERQNEYRKKIDWTGLSHTQLANELFLSPNIRIISSMVRRSAFERIGGFKENYFGGEDELFWFELALHGKIGHLNTILFHRREHDNNTVKVHKVDRLMGYLKSTHYINRKYHQIVKDNYKHKERSIYHSLIRSLIREKNYLLLIGYLMIALVKYPSSTIRHVIKKYNC